MGIWLVDSASKSNSRRLVLRQHLLRMLGDARRNALLALLEGQTHHARPRLAVAGDLVPVAHRLLPTFLLLVRRVLTDLLVDFLVQLLEVVAILAISDVRGVDLLVLLLILLLEGLHVLRHVAAEDALLVEVRIVLALVLARARLVARELLRGVRDVEAAVRGALEHREHLGADRRALEADVQDGLEGPAVALVVVLDVELLAIGLLLALEGVRKADLVERAAREQEPDAVARSVVLQPNLEAVLLELGGVRVGHDLVALDRRVDDLRDAALVREAHDEPVLRRVVLVLLLADHHAASAVVGLPLAAAAVLDLKALEVSAVLHNLDESHVDKPRKPLLPLEP